MKAENRLKDHADALIFQSAIMSQSLKIALIADEIIAILQAVCEFLIACHRSKLL